MENKSKKNEVKKSEIDINEDLSFEIKEQNQINSIKTSKYLEDLTNKGD